MPSHNETFFPARADRPDWDFVLNDFPFPLAVTCARLHTEMDRQEPIAAAWQLRDAFECLIKFTASLAVADFLYASPDLQAASEIAGLLLKPSGLSLGDWHTLIEMALAPLKPFAQTGDWDASGRILPGLYPVFFETKGQRLTPLNRKIARDPDNLVAWRNRVFGHGVFSQDRGYYAQETLALLPTLGEFYHALRHILAGRRLVSKTPGGEEVVWQGAGDLPSVPRHEHEPWGEPLPMFLAPASGFNLPPLPLTPFLSMQKCHSCGQPAAFFFDKNKYDRKQDRHSTAFLEYFNGHPGMHKNWPETRRLADLLPPTFEWERGRYSRKEVDGSQNIVFRDFDTEYLRPDYLLDAVWRITDEQTKGYIHLVGPGGVGKTYFVRGLSAEGIERDAPILSYHILPGARTQYTTFVSELNAHVHAHDRLDSQTQMQTRKVSTSSEAQAEFATYLFELKCANNLNLLIVAIDALDELADPAEHSFGITDFLPPPDLLPDGCFFVLTSREQMRPKVRADLARLQAAAPDAFTTLTLGTGDAANESLLRAYLAKHLPVPLQTPETVDAVLARCAGVFLYAFHLCRALEAGVFPDVATLPNAAQFYPAYLERLRARVGDDLYKTVYLPTLLLLCAAQQPVTLEQLARWGVPHDRLQFALLDLRDFLRVHRELPWQESANGVDEYDGNNRYEMAHEEFIRYVKSDTAMSQALQATHAEISHAIIYARQGQWLELNPAVSDEFYDLSYTHQHIKAARLQTDLVTYCLEDFVRANMKLGGYTEDHIATSVAYQYIVLAEGGGIVEGEYPVEGGSFSTYVYEWCDHAVDACQYLADLGRTKLPNHIALFLTFEANALCQDGSTETAVIFYDRAIAIWQHFELDKNAVLQANLASALLQCGIAFRADSELDEAVIRFDRAIPLLRRRLKIEEIQKPSDLHNWEVQVIADLLNALQYSFMIHYWESEWEAAGDSLAVALPYIAPFLFKEDIPDGVDHAIFEFDHHLGSIEDHLIEFLGVSEEHEIEAIFERIYARLDEKEIETLNSMIEWREKRREAYQSS